MTESNDGPCKANWHDRKEVYLRAVEFKYMTKEEAIQACGGEQCPCCEEKFSDG